MKMRVNKKMNEFSSAFTVKSGFIVSVFTYKEPTEEELKAQIEAKKIERAGGDPKKRRRGRR